MIRKTALFKLMVGLLVFVLSRGLALAVTNDLSVDPAVDLSSNRDEAVVAGTIECTKGATSGTATITVYIFQSVGRLLNIGIGSLGTTPLNCSGAGISDAWQVTVLAIPGLKFQPGPATVLVKVGTAVDNVADATTEIGARGNLHK